MPKLPSSRVAPPLRVRFWELFSEDHPWPPFPAYEGSGDPIYRTELSVSVIGIYGIGSHASYPHVHELLLHANTVSPSGVCPHWKLWRKCVQWTMPSIFMLPALAPNSTDFMSLPLTMRRIMTVNADDAVTDLPAFKHFLFLYKNLSDDGKPLLVILCILEWGPMFFMNSVPLYEKFFKEFDHTALEHLCPWSLPLSFLAEGQIGFHHIPVFVTQTPYVKLPAMFADMPVEPFEAFPEKLHICRETHVTLIACGIDHAHVKVPKIRFVLLWNRLYPPKIKIQLFFICNSRIYMETSQLLLINLSKY